MPGAGRHSRRRRSAAQFGAPWGRSVRFVTVLVVVVLAVVSSIPLLPIPGQAGSRAAWIPPCVTLAGLAIFSLFSVRGFSVQGRDLLIQRPLWQTRFPLDQLHHAYADSTAMKGSLRSAGNGGLFAFTGWFRNKKLGTYRAFVTDPNRCVVLDFKDYKIVVSPDDPDGFVKALGIGSDARGSC